MKKLILLSLFFTGMGLAQHSNTLTWQWSQGTGDPATGFNVKRSASPTGTFTTIASPPVTTLTYVDVNVVAGQTWYYEVTAFNTGGESLPSNTISATTPFSVPSGVPNALSVVSK